MDTLGKGAGARARGRRHLEFAAVCAAASMCAPRPLSSPVISARRLLHSPPPLEIPNHFALVVTYI